MTERSFTMVTLTFIFNRDKIEKLGYTEEELLRPMRVHAKKYNIVESSNGVFCKDGKDALCDVSMAIPKITDKNPGYIDLLDEWTLDIDGEKEDCIEETRKWFQKHGLQTTLG